MLNATPLDLTELPACATGEFRPRSLSTVEDWYGDAGDVRFACATWRDTLALAPSAPLAVDREFETHDANFSAIAFRQKSTSAVIHDELEPHAAEPGRFDVSFELALVSDYRRAGISRSGGAPAIQAGIDVDMPFGWSIGLSATTIEERKGANFEVALYGAKSFEFGETELTIGATAVMFPEGRYADFGVAQASVSRPFGPLDLTLAVNYAWEQAHLEDQHNFYAVLRARTPIGLLAGIPLTMGASLGRAEGRMAIAETRVDWSLSLVADVQGTDVGLTYVDTDLDDERGDPTCVLSIVRTF